MAEHSRTFERDITCVRNHPTKDRNIGRITRKEFSKFFYCLFFQSLSIRFFICLLQVVDTFRNTRYFPW